MNAPSGQPDPVTSIDWVHRANSTARREGDMNVPFGGVKRCGSGRDKSRHAMDEYTDLKTTWINYG